MTLRTSRSGFAGVYPMLLAFYDADERLDAAMFAREVDALVRHGAHGAAVLGLGTEINKLSLAERRAALDAVAEALDGRLPFSVTVGENTAEGQIAFARAAVDAGADWLILQPPPVVDVSELTLQRFFGKIADAIDKPIGIQNAPIYLGIGLSDRGLKDLHAQHPNIAIVKIEDGPLAVPPLIEATDGALDIFVGRGGLEMIELLRAGAVGIIPGFETLDRLARVYDLTVEGDEAGAEAAYGEVESVLVFLEQSINHYVTYSREIAGRRLGVETVHHRLGKALTPFGRDFAARAAARLGSL